MSLHTDRDAARDTIRKLKILEKEHGVHIAFAHDAVWMKTGQDPVLMSLLTDEMKVFTKTRLHNDEPF